MFQSFHWSGSGREETYCSLTTKMQLSCEGRPETGCLQVTFRSLGLERERGEREVGERDGGAGRERDKGGKRE